MCTKKENSLNHPDLYKGMLGDLTSSQGAVLVQARHMSAKNVSLLFLAVVALPFVLCEHRTSAKVVEVRKGWKTLLSVTLEFLSPANGLSDCPEKRDFHKAFYGPPPPLANIYELPMEHPPPLQVHNNNRDREPPYFSASSSKPHKARRETILCKASFSPPQANHTTFCAENCKVAKK